MTVLVALFIFALFLMQWAGVLLGVGAEMVILVTYLMSLQAQTPGNRELARGARTVARMALMAMIGSGLAIVVFHIALDQAEVLFAPAFMGKWILIGFVLFGYKLEQWVDTQKIVGQGLAHGVVGGTWLAILLLHTMAPDTTTPIIIGGYIVWMALFGVIWSGFIAGLSPKPESNDSARPERYAPELDEIEFEPKLEAVVAQKPAPIAQPIVAPVVAPIPQPVIVPVVAAAPAPVRPTMPSVLVAPPVIPKAPPIAPVVPKPMQAAPAPHPVMAAVAPKPVSAAPAPHPVAASPAPHPDNGLPSITVMPRTPEQVKGAWQF